MKKIPIFILLAIGLYIVLFLLYFLVPLIVSLCVGVWEYYKRDDDIEYQLKMLENGNLREKMIAADFMGQSKNVLTIPLLIKYIDVHEDLYPYRNKSPESLSCVITVSLAEITLKDIGDTCCYYDDCAEKNKEVIQKWKDWYKNEYPAWLEEQKQISG